MPADGPLKRRTKIAVVIGTLEVGGAELDIVRNFPQLNRDEFDVIVLAYERAGILAPELQRQGIRVIAGDLGTPAVSKSWLMRRIRTVAYLSRVVPWIGHALRAEQVDIAHFFLPNSYGYGMLACMLMRSKVRRVMSRLSLNFYSDTNAMLAWLERSVLHARVDIAIGNSRPILGELAEEGVDPAKLRLLHNGIDPAPFERHSGDRKKAREEIGIAQDTYVILAVGNLHTYKGHADLIEACALAAEQMPTGWRLLIAGRDQEGNRATLDALAAACGVAANVSFLGERDDVPLLLSAADVFAHPSHHEGLPNSIIEAMSASLPVIGTSVGGIPEAVLALSAGVGSDEETGWLVPPKDPDAIGAALVEASKEVDRRIQMGERARERAVAEFSLERSIEAYERIFRELQT